MDPGLFVPSAEETPASGPDWLVGRRVAFLGKLGGLTRKEADKLLREHGATTVDMQARQIDLIVVGADENPLDLDSLLSDDVRPSISDGVVELLLETELWERLGWVAEQQTIQRLYTPAMLAELTGVTVATVRRWHRKGLIVPYHEVHRLPYFDFQEVSTARKLADLLASGTSAQSIERKLQRLAVVFPHVERPLTQLSIIVEGRDLLLREEAGLIEPHGQLRIDFAAMEQDDDDADRIPTLTMQDAWDARMTAEDLIDQGARCEESGDLDAAAEFYRAALLCEGPNPELCFCLAELLYRMGDLSGARERYSAAIELDADYVEARANLGCVLAELGKLELAAAALQGAIDCHESYPDARYHLARVLDDLGRIEEAHHHWEAFLEMSPESPWAQEARDRLGW